MSSRTLFITALLGLFCVAAEAQTISLINGSHCVNSEAIYLLSEASCPSYNWSVTSGVNGTDYTIIGSTNTATLRVKWLRTFTSTVSCTYVCGSNGTATSPQFTINNSLSPTVTIAVSPGTIVCQSSTITFTATPTNVGSSPSYNWKINGTSVSTGSAATFSRSNFVNGDVVSVALTSNSVCLGVVTATSNSITMTVTTAVPVSATLTPPSIICSATPTNASFSVVSVINGGSSPTYTWYKNGNVVTDRVPGPPLWIYVPSTPLANGDRIKCKVTSNASCVSGNPFTTSEHIVSLTPPTTPAVSVQVPKFNYCSGETISFTASSPYTSGASTYSWKLNGNQFATTSSASLPVSSDVNATSSFRPGAVVTVNVTGLTGTCLSSSTGVGTTSNIPIVIYPLPTVSISPAGTVKILSTATQAITATSGYSYQWKKDGVFISPAVIVNPYVANVSGTYSVVASKNGCTKESNSMTLIKNIRPIANAGVDQAIPLKLPAPSGTLNGSGSDADGSISTYLWRMVSGPNSPAISGITTANLSISNMVSGSYVFGLVVTDNFGEQSIEDLITVSVVYPANNFNSVRETSVLVKNKFTEADVVGLQVPNGEVNVTSQYFDGIGRLIQTVSQQSSPSGKDIIIPNVYDGFGREWRKYLSATTTQMNGYYVLNSDVVDNSTGNYKGIAAGTYSDVRPFSETTIEPSPLNRSIKELGPGKDWLDGNKAVNFQLITNVHGLQNNLNEEKVIIWKINSKLPVRNTAINSGFYVSASLLVKITKDEDGKEVREYQDCLGKTILKKAQVAESPTGLNSSIDWALTYYVYDDFGNLAFVLQPELSKTLVASDTYNPSVTDLNNYAFQFTYDRRQRVVTKKLPGADSVYIIYDSRDRIILTQSGNQRKDSKKEWSFTKYDGLNRPIITGVYTHGSFVDRMGMISAINAYNFEESYNGVASSHGYTNVGFPTSNAVVLLVTYYDNYKFKTDMAGASYDYVPNDLTGQDVMNTNVKGHITGTKTNILGSANYLWSVNYYDAKYRVIQVKKQNHKNQLDRITSLYDFTKLIESRAFHTNITTYSVHRKYDYDHTGRLKKLWHKFHNESSFVLLKEIVYNEHGQPARENLHSRDGGVSFSQKTDYSYNIRGWLQSINNPSAPEAGDLFSEELKFNNPTSSGGPPSFNGNISEQIWKTAGYDRQSYGFKFDPMNRLLEANYFNSARPLLNGRNTEKVFHGAKSPYDLNGNINGLVRNGKKSSTGGFGITDQLRYLYVGNRLTSVDDTEPEYGYDDGFKDGVESTNEYSYDGNGNMIRDDNKGITEIAYNHMNLPVQVKTSPTNYVVFTYDASGAKLTQKVYGSSAKTTEYIGEYTYENTGSGDMLKYVLHDQGRIVPDNSAGAPRPWEYQYFLKDHLGNIRVTFSEKKSTIEYKSNFESATQPEFFKYNNYGVLNIYDHSDVGGTYTKSHLLHGGNNSQVGLSKSLEVNAGDIFDIEVYAKYEKPPDNPLSNNLGNFLTGLVSAFSLGSGSTPLDGSQALSAFNGLFPGGTPWITNSKWEDANAPKAYLNYILFDQNFALVDFGFDQLSASAKQVGTSPVVPHDYLNLHLRVGQKGYLYIYLSNENPLQTNVYFDDINIAHNSAIEQAADYYPFGLTYNNFQRTNSTKQNFKFQGQEHIDDLGLGWDSFKWRNHQPDIGRFFNLDPLAEKYISNSPYAFSENRVVSHVELEGLEAIPFSFFLDVGAVTNATVEDPGVGDYVATGIKMAWLSSMVGSGLNDMVQGTQRQSANAYDFYKNGGERMTQEMLTGGSPQKVISDYKKVEANAKEQVTVGAAKVAVWGATTQLSLISGSLTASELFLPSTTFGTAVPRNGQVITVLGKHPYYLDYADELGANRFDIPKQIWKKMSIPEQEAANLQFLDDAIRRGDKFYLSHAVKDINEVSGAYRLELDYLIEKGYKFNSTGTQMIK